MAEFLLTKSTPWENLVHYLIFFFRASKQFKDQFIPPYTPVFKDGWVPPEVIAGKDVSNLSAAIAANAANAAAVAQLTDGTRKVRKAATTSGWEVVVQDYYTTSLSNLNPP